MLHLRSLRVLLAFALAGLLLTARAATFEGDGLFRI